MGGRHVRKNKGLTDHAAKPGMRVNGDAAPFGDHQVLLAGPGLNQDNVAAHDRADGGSEPGLFSELEPP